MPLYPDYEKTAYPASSDYFQEMRDGDDPNGLIEAALVNRVSNVLQVVQPRIQYTPQTPTPSGTEAILLAQTMVLPQDLPNQNATMVFLATPKLPDGGGLLIGAPVNMVVAFYGDFGDPRVGLIPFVQAYYWSGGVKVFYQATAGAVVAQQPTSSVQIQVRNYERNWRKGDVIEAMLLLVRCN